MPDDGRSSARRVTIVLPGLGESPSRPTTRHAAAASLPAMAYTGQIIHNPVSGERIRFLQTSHGTRASVLKQIQATRAKDGLLGSFSFDRYGDMTPPKVPVFRVTGSTPPTVRVPSEQEGAVVDRVVTIPESLRE